MPKSTSRLPAVLIDSWKGTQAELRARLHIAPLDPLPRYVAGADMAYSADSLTAYAAAVVYDRQTQQIVDLAHAVRPVEVPYIPTFLSFREAPAVIEALERLEHPFGVVCFDGQGYAHPRRCGLATHVAVTLDVPGIGVTKTRLIGEHDEPGPLAGDSAALTDRGEPIGIVLRTQNNIRPLYVSIGHRVDLDTARALLMACCTKYRIPEPTRQADIEVAKLKRYLSAEA